MDCTATIGEGSMKVFIVKYVIDTATNKSSIVAVKATYEEAKDYIARSVKPTIPADRFFTESWNVGSEEKIF